MVSQAGHAEFDVRANVQQIQLLMRVFGRLSSRGYAWQRLQMVSDSLDNGLPDSSDG